MRPLPTLDGWRGSGVGQVTTWQGLALPHGSPGPASARRPGDDN
jgi:hypothetical protein